MIEGTSSESIEYVGKFGVTQTCIDGMLRYLQFDEPIKEAKLITNDQRHGFILYTEERRDTIVVRAGFCSGYQGEAPRGLSYALSLLEEFEIEVDEFEVSSRLFQRLNRCQLTDKDLLSIDNLQPVRPAMIYEYMLTYPKEHHTSESCMPIPIPLKLIDERIRDLAIRFWADPDARIQTGFRRLEDAVRSRCQLEEHGAKLFQPAFMGDASHLTWAGLTSKEQAARADLFKAAWGSFRNPRAHKELDHSPEDLLSEFLVLNQLFRLESQAIKRLTPKK